MGGEPNYPIASVDSALRLLLMLRDQPQLRVADVADRLGVARSTAHRLLAMLVAHDFVSRDPDTKLYSAGTALLTLGLAAVRNYDVRTHMRPYLEKLAAEVGETSHLIVLHGADSFFVDSCESDHAVRTGSRVGISFPAYSSSGGKALLAELSAEELHGLYPDEQLQPMSPNTVSTRSDLEAELAAVRDRGYALNLGETDEEVGAIAAVVRGPSDVAVCALAVAAPLARTSREKLTSMAQPLLELCAQAGRAGAA